MINAIIMFSPKVGFCEKPKKQIIEWLSPKHLAPGKPVMNVRLSVQRWLRILGVEIVFLEIRQRAIYCPRGEHTEPDVMKIVALAGV